MLFQRQVNSTSALTVNGLEVNWVQPLDFVLGRIGLNGFGISANLTVIDQRGSGQAFTSATSTPAVALGVAPHTYNGTLYYDNQIVSARLSGTFTKGSQTDVTNQNGIADAALFGDDYKQWDFSSSVDLSKLFHFETDIQATLDVINIFESKQRSYSSSKMPRSPSTARVGSTSWASAAASEGTATVGRAAPVSCQR